MKRQRLLWQIFPSYVLIILLSLCMVTWFALRRTERMYQSQLERELLSQTLLLERAIRTPDGGLLPEAQVALLCRDLGQRLPVRLTVLLADGRVIGDSDEDPAVMENHIRRPEVQAAIARKRQVVDRYSSTVQKRMLYMVTPLSVDGKDVMYVRVAMPFTDIDEAIGDVFRQFAGAALVAILLAVIAGLLVARRLTKPLESMRQGVLRFAQGDLSYRLPVSGSVEMAELADAINRMASQLDSRLHELAHERNTRTAVFDSMSEGLLAVDEQRRIIHINQAALRLLKLEGRQVIGDQIETLVRNSGLQRMLKQALAGDELVDGDVEISGGRESVQLAVRGTALRNHEGMRIGALVVMQDMTRIRQLEKMRQDFVANVSHELKTPITSIKGFVETLMDGAAEDPVARTRFLGIVARQAEHLNAIVADLLLLSSVEHQERTQAIRLEYLPMRPLVEAAIDVCRAQAEKRRITVQLECDPQLATDLSPHLFEQALVNLLDNAIKYSGEDSAVTVAAVRREGEIMVSVLDNGSGIEQRHLERIFERFYRVDKGRSRQLGGTGLGLSIVRHIAMAHGGRVSAESRLGEGSVFRIYLPLRERNSLNTNNSLAER